MKNIYLANKKTDETNDVVIFEGYVCEDGKCVYGQIAFEKELEPTTDYVFGRFGQLTTRQVFEAVAPELSEPGNPFVPLQDEKEVLEILNTNVMAILNYEKETN